MPAPQFGGNASLMLTARHAAIRLLKLTMVASLVFPAVLFAFAGWVSYRNFERVTDERIYRSLDILHEHALKVLQTLDRTFAEVDEILRGMSDDEIRSNEGPLHQRLDHIVQALPQLQGIATHLAAGIVEVAGQQAFWRLRVGHHEHFVRKPSSGRFVLQVLEEDFELIASHFRAPEPEEAFNVIHHTR